jgi:hypothetical protein
VSTRLYRREGDDYGMLVYFLSDGKLVRVDTLAEWVPVDGWSLTQETPGQPLSLRYPKTHNFIARVVEKLKTYVRPKTPRRGAADDRENWMEKIRRMQTTDLEQTRAAALEELINFGWSMTERNKERENGL